MPEKKGTRTFEYLTYFQCSHCKEYFRRGKLEKLEQEEATAAKLLLGEFLQSVCFGCAVIEEGENLARS